MHPRFEVVAKGSGDKPMQKVLQESYEVDNKGTVGACKKSTQKPSTEKPTKGSTGTQKPSTVPSLQPTRSSSSGRGSGGGNGP